MLRPMMNTPAEQLRRLSWRLKSLLSYSPRLKQKRGLKRPDTLLHKFSTQQQARLTQLEQRYSLDDWPQLCNEIEYRENLYLLDLLDQHLAPLQPNAPGLDIGCRNFNHLPALTAFAPGPWHGVEIDAHARYLNGYTRRAYGEWMAAHRPGSRHIADSVMTLEGQYKFISWSLPYVLPEPLQQRGLPMSQFQPLRRLEKAWSLLASNGVMLIVNQGEIEREAQQVLLHQAGITAEPLGLLASVFSPFQKTRYGWRLTKH